METIVGIDLGTTNSTITAIDENGKTTFIKNKFNQFITPSAVYFEKQKGNVLVGKEAKEKSSTDPKNLVLFVKREMGKAKNAVRHNIIEDKYNPYKFWGKTYSPEEISALILKQLKKDAEKQLGKKIKKAVITCPAYFHDAERNATKAAGEMAGFEVLEILSEPVAAAFSYAAQNDKEETVLVFDLGGGTFDVTILKTKNSDGGRKVEMIVTDGNHKLGGKDWDDYIIGYLIERFNKRFQIDIDQEPKDAKNLVYGKLRIEVEKAKVELFKDGVSQVQIPVEYGGKRHVETITREMYAQKTEKLTYQCRIYCENILQTGNLSWSDIDTILMIGNMSNCTTIQDALKSWSGKEISFGIINPKTSVSEGAAIRGYLLEGGKIVKKLVKTDNQIADFDQKKEVAERVEKQEQEGERTETEFDNKEMKSGVLPSSVGIRVKTRSGEDTIFKFFDKNSSYPEEKTQSFPMLRSGDEKFTLQIYEGESKKIDECNLLGSVVVELDGKMSKNDKLKITLQIDANGILQVKAENLNLGIKVESKISRETDVSEEEIQKSAEEIEEFYLG